MMEGVSVVRKTRGVRAIWDSLGRDVFLPVNMLNAAMSGPVDEQQLFERLFQGRDDACDICTAIDVVGAGRVAPTAELAAVDATLKAASASLVASAGLAQHQGVFSLVDEDKLASFNGRKNAARVAFHAELQKKLEAKLDNLIQAKPVVVLQTATSPRPARAAAAGELGTARQALTHLSATHGITATAFLLGVQAVLSRQAVAGHHHSGTGCQRVSWHLKRANLINGGEAFVEDAVALLRILGFQLVTPVAALESGERDEDETVWALLSHFWARSQLRSLSNSVRVERGMAPAGRLSVTSDQPHIELLPETEWLSWCALL